VSVMAQEEKSKPGWQERRRQKKHEKRLRKIHTKPRRRKRNPDEPGMGFWIGWGGF